MGAASVDHDKVYALTTKAKAELNAAGTSLSTAELKLLVLIDGRASVAQIIKAAAPLIAPEAVLEVLEKLQKSGHIAAAADVASGGIEVGDFFTQAVAPAAADAQAASESDAGLASLQQQGYFVRIARRGAVRKLAKDEKLTVLVVEDDPQLAKLLRTYLAMEDMIPRLAANREEIAAALNQAPKPDLVLLDVTLPDVDGFDVLARIRQHDALKTTAVIMLTGKATREAVLKGLLGGADGYVTKPFDIEALFKAVKSVIGLR
jgi:CheY-like chemotaxis protein